MSYISSTQYINSQRLFLRQQFLLPLRELVRLIHRKRSLQNVMPLQIAFQEVQIKLNMHFPNAHSSKLLFVDVLAAQRNSTSDQTVQCEKSLEEALLKIKTGSLFCFTTSYDFDNLILATVVGTDVKQIRRGYVST